MNVIVRGPLTEAATPSLEPPKTGREARYGARLRPIEPGVASRVRPPTVNLMATPGSMEPPTALDATGW